MLHSTVLDVGVVLDGNLLENLSDLANSSNCRSIFWWISCGGFMGVGAKDRPFLSNCNSCTVSDLVLKLCIPMSDLV